MSKLARDHRNSDLAKIHVAKKALSMSDEDYRAMLQAQGGVHSAGELTHDGRLRVLQHLQRLGFKPVATAKTKRRPARPTPSADALPMVRRIRAQLISLGNLPDVYADGIAQQMLGAQAPEFFEWCHPADLYKITQALGVEQRRKGVNDGR